MFLLGCLKTKNGRLLRPKEVKMEKIEEKNLQLSSIIDSLEETLKLSPFFVPLSQEELESIGNRILNPDPTQPASNRRH